ncbi:Gfo/Idh/MocA family protein [Chengkuizengella axinellae]|uniref:Gfo/Idh/MocA family oxidoreductase n=1 Tax=Chengkuizengella axinellae TaxID=3064388 RepID=A0ABT9ITD4_9BACL|nr:Gfo/Idh/MocA family oxidoreductase [Chengkuizengella sp. 2205SS18-9]MDP5272616.1 Gfo/Idh/MocA family oxidoreductase [Chengkuizengella sp. 2205SS18-9]
MRLVRVGIIGLGLMGTRYVKYFEEGKVDGATLTAVVTSRKEQRDWVNETFNNNVDVYKNLDELIASGKVDAIIVATPHYHHPAAAIQAFQAGYHVLIEKPAGVYTKQVREMNETALKSGKVFGIMYNQRTNPLYMKLRDIIQSGELGEIYRTNWTVSNWFRTQSYYDAVSWRSSWNTDGGGVLMNQSPHQLDLWQWTTGMIPKRIRAFCHFGKYHNIEVEDDVTAYVEYENGATGVFITSTGEAPGTNRYEISGTQGKIVIENNKLSFWRLRESTYEFNERYKDGGFSKPECWECEIPIQGEAKDGHLEVIVDWIDSIRNRTPLLSPGEEGMKGLMMANAMLLSTWTDNWVELPIDEDLFYEYLIKKIKSSEQKE